jgi:asparagine synthase (glutamine-hydrolysing)
MCGLAGVFGYLGRERTERAVECMLGVQAHRGPDSAGVWCQTVNGVDVGVGLRRLKILDLSDTANQPMLSEDQRYVLVFNGEIYNYLELRNELLTAGVRFHTQGDTEVLLQSLIKWGPRAFKRLNGMWAIAFLDTVKGELCLSRDRFGIKPLYVYTDTDTLFVSSEIKAILEAVGRKFRIEMSTVKTYLTQSILCATPATFFSNINEFPAGHFCKVMLRDIKSAGVKPERYWQIPTSMEELPSERELIQTVRETFMDAVRLRLRSDVPVGVLLSGGTDSSAIAAAVEQLEPSREDIKLISAVGNRGEQDEQSFIDAMAKHLNRPVEKVVLEFSPSRAIELLAEVSWFNDEPIMATFSTVAHYLLMKRAKELNVTVLLSGQGADETLCGYRKYLGFYLQNLFRSGQWLTAGRTLNGFVWQGTVLSQFNYQEAKRYLPNWLRYPEIDIRGPALRAETGSFDLGLNGTGIIGRQAVDIEKFSVPALVHYEDRMSMAFSREIRLPFLDYRLVSLLLPLPEEFKLRSGWTKWIFRKAMEPFLPKEIAWRKDKQHFLVPQRTWLRNELRDEILKFTKTEWLTERFGIISRKKFEQLYRNYLWQPAATSGIGTKDILAPIVLEQWARRFASYLTT